MSQLLPQSYASIWNSCIFLQLPHLQLPFVVEIALPTRLPNLHTSHPPALLQLPHLLSGTTSPSKWLQQLHASLPALELPGVEGGPLLQAAFRGLAYVCSGGGGGSSNSQGGQGSCSSGQGGAGSGVQVQQSARVSV